MVEAGAWLPDQMKGTRQNYDWDLYPAEEITMLWTICVVLAILWLLGFSLHVGGGLIHLLLVVALVIMIINVVSGNRSAA